LATGANRPPFKGGSRAVWVVSSLKLLPQKKGIDWRKPEADGTKDHPVWASVPIETEPSKYDLVVLLALNPIRVYESIRVILSGTAGTEYGRLPWLALSVLGGHTSNAASDSR
jgi:hypothetical protein